MPGSLSPPLEALGGFLTAVVAALGAWLVSVRKLSGRINTSEATQLWEESARMREEYRTRIAALETRIAALEERNVLLERENLDLRNQLFNIHHSHGEGKA